jgi:four helix bundle protein
MNTGVKSHKDLIVWQKSIELSLAIYTLTDTFPKKETYGLSAQMRRAAVSIPSKIAEGRARHSRKDFAHFLHIAFGSAAELETQLLIAKKLSFVEEADFTRTNSLISEVSKMLRAMIEKLGTDV